jgi:hypothetical protein
MIDLKREEKIFARFDGRAGPSLAALCGHLLADQKKTWPDLAAGHEALAAVCIHDIPCPGFSVRVQFNQRRIASSTARVDPESIRKRKCFLCPGNLPTPQKGILYRREYLILCNPAPIFSRHYTISSLRHVPQALEEHLNVLLLLAEDLSGDATVLYNGPRSGASAPDHFHFQAAPSGAVPIEGVLDEKGRKKRIQRADGASLSRATNLGRTALIMEGSDARGVADLTLTVIGEMKKISREPGEPMMNVLCSHGKSGWRVTLFPRGRHRPDMFYRGGDEQVLISPGAVDMGGLIITSRERDFRILDSERVQAVFREVSLDEAKTAALLRALQVKPPRTLESSGNRVNKMEALS